METKHIIALIVHPAYEFAADEVFVTDFYNDRVQKFSAEGELLAVLPVLPNPGGIAIGREDPGQPANRLRTERAPADEWMRFLD